MILTAVVPTRTGFNVELIKDAVVVKIVRVPNFTCTQIVRDLWVQSGGDTSLNYEVIEASNIDDIHTN